MCGIAGILTKQNYPSGDLDRVVTLFNQQLQHRGPDAEGSWCYKNLRLAHRRLSILDLSAQGNQPMLSKDENIVISYNGEIYNFREIKEELKAKGYTFVTSTDTEVILNAYREWDCDAFARFNGMFALALLDKQKQELILARDHAGIKPLYYHLSDDKLIFSSEIRCFRQFDPSWPENPNWSFHFLSFGFIPFPYTTLRDVVVMPKGHYMKVDINSLATVTRAFHQVTYSQQVNNEKDALEKIRSTLIAAVDHHMISDAPLGIFLSGGVDSSLLALIADYRKHPDLKTLSVTFDEATFDERPFQRIVNNRMRKHLHQENHVSSSMFMDWLPDIFMAMDQPSWDGVNSYFVSKCAHQANLKVVLSGLGSDELFGGYPSFSRTGLLKSLRWLPSPVKSLASRFHNDLGRISFLGLPTNYNEYLFLRGGFDPLTISKLTATPLEQVIDSFRLLNIENMPAVKDQNLISFLETNVYMESQLLKDTDFMSMWHSLEVRVPFLDKELMDLTSNIHPSIKFNNTQPKYLITKAFEDLLPREIIFRKKQGFTFPFDLWLRNNMDFFRPMLPDSPVSTALLNNFLAGKLHWSRIWALVVWKRFREGMG